MFNLNVKYLIESQMLLSKVCFHLRILKCLWDWVTIFYSWSRESSRDFPGGSDSEECVCSVGALGSIPGSGSSPGEGNGYPLYYSCLENSMDRGAWWATIHGFTKSRTWLSNWTEVNWYTYIYIDIDIDTYIYTHKHIYTYV